MLPVPAGPFLMGDETTHTVTIETPFAIARHPATNAQYRRFIEDGGYTDRWRRCWTADGWRYFEGISRRHRQPIGNPNQPVVGVSWYEAAAYAGWLAATTGRPYRLPTEAEWERAARHTDGRTYPWRDSWQELWSHRRSFRLPGHCPGSWLERPLLSGHIRLFERSSDPLIRIIG